MPNKSTILRQKAFARQQGRCYYCCLPMWEPNDCPADKAPLLLSTAEHLVPRSQGGRDARANIVAACLHCNQARGRFKVAPPPESFRSYVRERVAEGYWHPYGVERAGR